MCKTLLPLKLVVDADDWQFWGKTKLIILNFKIIATPAAATFSTSIAK